MRYVVSFGKFQVDAIYFPLWNSWNFISNWSIRIITELDFAQRTYGVIITSLLRKNDVAVSFWWRYYCLTCPLGVFHLRPAVMSRDVTTCKSYVYAFIRNQYDTISRNAAASEGIFVAMLLCYMEQKRSANIWYFIKKTDCWLRLTWNTIQNRYVLAPWLHAIFNLLKLRNTQNSSL